MPTYDYVCSACGHRLEVVHGIHGHGPEVCPVCGGSMRKAFVVPTVHFKGSGWAKKDRGAAASTKAAAKAGGAGDGSAGEAGGGSSDGSTKDASAKKDGATKGAPDSTNAASGTASESGSAKPKTAAGGDD